MQRRLPVMPRLPFAAVLSSAALASLLACGGEPPADADSPAPVPAATDDGDDIAAGPPAEAAGDGDGASAADPASDDDTSMVAAEPPGDATTPAAPPACKKKITVVFTVGVPGKSKMVTNGCWTPLITDGAAVASFRKCSTTNYQVKNATAPNWAYDDTNPQHPLTQEKNFANACANGASGDGYEFMAYRSGWRYVSEPGLKAYFAELYTSATNDIATLYDTPAIYKTNASVKAHTRTYPMMNFGPPASAHLENKVKSTALTLCNTVADGGYLGMYNATWPSGMAANDPRLLALEAALDQCTKK